MFYLVYKITNTVNGMWYIGAHATERIDDGYRGSGVKLREAMDQYGLDVFKKEIVYQAQSKDEMLAVEASLVEISDRTYNLIKEDRAYHFHSEDTKKRMSEAASERTGSKNSQFGSKWITDGIQNRKLHRDQILPDGWRFGRVKGTTSGTHFVKFRIASMVEGQTQKT